MYLTEKQLELIRVISEANSDGSSVDLDEIIERANYKPSKQSAQFSIRSLIEHGLIEKTGAENRRGRKRVLISITALGQHFAGAYRLPAYVTSVAVDEALNEQD